jgi:plastocyanin
MATYNISVLSSSGTSNGYRFSGSDKNGSISSSTNNPTINVNSGDTINFTFYNSTSHPFRISGTSISGNSATGGYYSSPTTASYTFSSATTYTYVCNVHSSMTGSIVASSVSTTTTTTAAPTTAAPTTAAPTTAAPTTVAPTTVAPTTVAPTTAAPIISTPTIPATPVVSPSPSVPVVTPSPSSTQIITDLSSVFPEETVQENEFNVYLNIGYLIVYDNNNVPTGFSNYDGKLETLVANGYDRNGPISRKVEHLSEDYLESLNQYTTNWLGDLNNPVREWTNDTVGIPTSRSSLNVYTKWIVGGLQVLNYKEGDIVNFHLPGMRIDDFRYRIQIGNNSDSLENYISPDSFLVDHIPNTPLEFDPSYRGQLHTDDEGSFVGVTGRGHRESDVELWNRITSGVEGIVKQKNFTGARGQQERPYFISDILSIGVGNGDYLPGINRMLEPSREYYGGISAGDGWQIYLSESDVRVSEHYYSIYCKEVFKDDRHFDRMDWRRWQASTRLRGFIDNAGDVGRPSIEEVQNTRAILRCEIAGGGFSPIHLRHPLGTNATVNIPIGGLDMGCTPKMELKDMGYHEHNPKTNVFRSVYETISGTLALIQSNILISAVSNVDTGGGTNPTLPPPTPNTTLEPITADNIGDRPERVHLEQSSGRISVPIGSKISLKINENKYPLLHDASSLVDDGRQMISVTKILSDSSVNYSELTLVFEDQIEISGQISISISSYEDQTLIAHKNVSGIIKDITFTCSEIINKIDVQNKTLLITIKSLCSVEQDDCCETLERLEIITEVSNFCIYDPCEHPFPSVAFFTTRSDTQARLLLAEGSRVVLDTGIVNTNSLLSNYISTQGDKTFFTNNSGTSYVLDYTPTSISNISSISTGRVCENYNLTDHKDLYVDQCFNLTSSVLNASTWVFPFDICNIKACVLEEGA